MGVQYRLLWRSSQVRMYWVEPVWMQMRTFGNGEALGGTACMQPQNSTVLMCAGIRDLTLRGAALVPADLAALTALRHLSRCTERGCKGLDMNIGKIGRCQACTIEMVTACKHISRGPA